MSHVGGACAQSACPRVKEPSLQTWTCRKGISLTVLVSPGEAQKKRRLGLKYHGPSATTCKLLEMVGRGQTNITAAAKIARAVEQDCGSACGKALMELASCGCHGKHDGNNERDFWRWAKGGLGVDLEPYEIKLVLNASWV